MGFREKRETGVFKFHLILSNHRHEKAGVFISFSNKGDASSSEM